MMKNLGIIFLNKFSYFKKVYYMNEFKFTNRLINEKSLYLLQHAHNPVDWYPWGDEAISRAREEDKLIFVSIGYSSCHWCHVMEKESFEDEEIAGILNKFFISIKIDREEFPDLDNYFMNYVQALTGRGGWPLNVFLTPGLTQIFGGTYFPPKEKCGLPSSKKVLLKLINIYINSLVLKAFILAYRATFDINFYKLAEETANFLTDRLIKDKVLFHYWVDNELKFEDYAEDYFNLINALLDFYEISFEPSLFFNAKQIYDDAYNKFFNENNLLAHQQSKQKFNFL